MNFIYIKDIKPLCHNSIHFQCHLLPSVINGISSPLDSLFTLCENISTSLTDSKDFE